MANVPTTSWSESSPAGTDSISLGDNRIREFKTQVREVIDVDHDFPSSGQATDNGQHKRVTLQEQADLGSGAEGTTILGSQTIDGKGELVYTDEDDNDIQITSKGKILASSLSTTLAHWSEVMKLIYPVGSIYINASVTTNPDTLLGFGTWVAFGTGRVMVGKDGSDTSFDVLEETGGSKTVDTSHTHTVSLNWGTSNNSTNGVLQTRNSVNPVSDARDASGDKTTSSSGSTTLSILQPYIVVCMWKRTA